MSRPPRARQPIKDAALDLFVTQGVHATGIREIAKQAGCSEAALYRHWANKDDLVTSLFAEHIGEVVQQLESAMAEHDDFAAKVGSACRAIYRLYDEQPLVFRFVMLVRHEQVAFIKGKLRMPQDVLTELILTRVRDERRARILAAAAMGIFLQIAEFVVYGRLEAPLEDYAEEVTTLVVDLVKVASAPAA